MVVVADLSQALQSQISRLALKIDGLKTAYQGCRHLSHAIGPYFGCEELVALPPLPSEESRKVCKKMSEDLLKKPGIVTETEFLSSYYQLLNLNPRFKLDPSEILKKLYHFYDFPGHLVFSRAELGLQRESYFSQSEISHDIDKGFRSKAFHHMASQTTDELLFEAIKPCKDHLMIELIRACQIHIQMSTGSDFKPENSKPMRAAALLIKAILDYQARDTRTATEKVYDQFASSAELADRVAKQRREHLGTRIHTLPPGLSQINKYNAEPYQLIRETLSEGSQYRVLQGNKEAFGEVAIANNPEGEGVMVKVIPLDLKEDELPVLFNTCEPRKAIHIFTSNQK